MTKTIYKSILAAMVLSILILSGIGSLVGQDSEADGGVLAKIFIDTLGRVVSGDIEGAASNIELVGNASLPQDLQWIHRGVYRDLNRILGLIDGINSGVDQLSREFSGDLAESVKAMLLDLYGLRLNVEDDLYEYMDALLKYVEAGERQFFREALETGIESFLQYLDGFVVGTGEYIRDLEARYGYRILDVEPTSYPELLYAAGSALITLDLEWIGGRDVSNLSLKAYLRLGWITLAEYNFPLPNVDESIDISLAIPGADELAGKGVILTGGESIPIYLFIDIYGVVGGSPQVLGSTIIKTNLTALEPRINVVAPQSIRLGEDLVIDIYSEAESIVNASIYLDGDAVEYIVVRPGLNRLVIHGYMLEKGRHTLTIETMPTGRYSRYRYVSTVDVTGIPIEAGVGFQPSYLWPATPLKVYGEIFNYSGSSPLYLSIYRGEALIDRVPVRGSFDVDVYLPPPALASIERITLSIGPDDPLYDAFTTDADIVSVNLISILAFSVLGLFAAYLGVSLEREVVFRGLVSGVRRLREAASRGAEGVRRFRELVVEGLVRSRAASLYWAFIDRFSRVLGRAYPHETLREYLGRISPVLPENIRGLFRDLTLLVERDLYSKESVDESVVRGLVRRIRDALV